jgi:hypothetical protein
LLAIVVRPILIDIVCISAHTAKMIISSIFSQYIQRGFFICGCITLLFFLGVHWYPHPTDYHFYFLAQSLIQGRFDFISLPMTIDGLQNINDVVIWGDRFYWALGPLPILLFVPLAIINQYVPVEPQIASSIVHVPAIFLAGYAAYIAMRAIGIDRTSRYYLTMAWMLSTPMLGMVSPSGYYLSHIIVSVGIFTALALYFREKKRWLSIGMIFAAIAATRITAASGILVFVYFALRIYRHSPRLQAQSLVRLLLPLCITLIALSGYNFARFSNPWETGYNQQQLTIPDLFYAREVGIVHAKHLPSNIYHFLLRSPEPVTNSTSNGVLEFPFIRASWWGMGIFFMAPYLLSLFFYPKNNWHIRILLLGSGIVAIPIFLYYGIGYIQFGYRYSLDFLPYAFTAFGLTLLGARPANSALSNQMKAVIILSCIWCAYLYFTMIFFLPA